MKNPDLLTVSFNIKINRMKLPKMKTHLARVVWSQHLKKTVFCIAFFFSFSLFYNCSGDDQTDPNPNTSTPYSVTIGNQNKNMPTGGVITSQYSDSPSGSDIGKVADNRLRLIIILK